VLRCTRCARREIVGSETCLVCNNTGVERLRLFRIISNEPVATGKLCSTCAHELSSQTVAGWYALREDQPACLNGGESNRRAG
jgi:hypothetical protein